MVAVVSNAMGRFTFSWTWSEFNGFARGQEKVSGTNGTVGIERARSGSIDTGNDF